MEFAQKSKLVGPVHHAKIVVARCPYTEETLMRLFLFALIFVTCTGPANANSCKNRFVELLVNGNQKMGPVRIHITQEIVGGKTSLNYHHSDGDGNGMTEMIDPAGDPWSLFLGDKMYMSNDRGKNWKFLSSYDAEKSRADTKSALTKDAATADGISCGEEELIRCCRSDVGLINL